MKKRPVKVEPDPEPPLIPCPICKKIRNLMPSRFGHPSVMECERPTCIYKRTLMKSRQIRERLEQQEQQEQLERAERMHRSL